MFENINNFISKDNIGKFIIIKSSEKEALENMKKGEFWFRHPAFYNLQENQNGNKVVGDMYDNKLHSISTNTMQLQADTIKFEGILQGKNLDCEATNQVFIHKEQDYERQISFYKLRIDEDGRYISNPSNLTFFGYKHFSLVNISRFIAELNLEKKKIIQKDCEYGDINTHNGKCGSFYKRNYYKHQNEYRVILASNCYKVEIDSNPSFKELSEENGKLIDIICNQNSLSTEKLMADKIHKSLELKIEQLKSSIVDKKTLSNNLISKPIDICELTNKFNIYEWEG